MPFDNPDTPSTTLTLSDVEEVVKDAPDLGETQRRDLLSALRCLKRIAKQPLWEIPAATESLRELLAHTQPAELGMSAKRFANLKCDIARALRLAGAIRPKPTQELRPQWAGLMASIEDPETRTRVSRFMKFCSDHAIEPQRVDDAVMDQFSKHLRSQTLMADPDKMLRRTIKHWNQAIKEIPGWPQVELAPLPGREGWTIPLEQFPKTFRDDIEVWLARLRGDDPLDDKAPIRPLRPASLEAKAFDVRLFASALVRQGRPIGEITSLVTLVDVESFKEGLRFLLNRSGGQPTRQIHGIAQTIVAIAKHHVEIDGDHLEELQRLRSRVRVDYTELTERNAERLRQFDDPRNVYALLDLPERLMQAAARRKLGPKRRAVLAQMAVAVMLSLHCGLRLGTLVKLRADTHIRWIGSGRRRRAHIRVAGQETKNRRPQDFELRPDHSRLLATYLEKYRPLLPGDTQSWLFPGRGGNQPKHSHVLGNQFKETVRREIGLTVNQHLCRHIGAKLVLDAKPGHYEVVRRTLGHASIDTTTKFYCGFETKAAARQYDDAILGHRNRPTSSRRRYR